MSLTTIVPEEVAIDVDRALLLGDCSPELTKRLAGYVLALQEEEKRLMERLKDRQDKAAWG